MYKLTRDELKEMVGANVGTRLFSQLQRDRARVMFASYVNKKPHPFLKCYLTWFGAV